MLLVFSRLIIGGSGWGKSEGTLNELMRIARSMAIVLFDPHGSLARKFMLHLLNEGMQHRVLYDRISDFDRLLAGFKFEQSVHPNLLKRESENSKRIMGLIDLMWRASKREGDVHAMPSMSEGADHALRLLMFQEEPVSLSLLPYAFRFKHPMCNQLIENCTDDDIAEEWRELQRLDRQHSDKILESKIGPIKRLTRQTFGLPAFRERCDGHFDIGQALLNKQIIIVDGSDDGTVTKQSVTAVYGAMNLQIDQFLRKNFTQTGKPCPVLVVWEEAGATDIIGANEIDMLRELRKTGFAGWIINQDANFGPPEMWATIKSCTPEKVWYNPGDDVLGLDAAKSIAYRKLDPHRVKYVHESEKMIFDGWEEVVRKGVSVSGDKKTESENFTERARYRPVRESRPEFMSLDDQIKLEVQKIMCMGKGWRMIQNPDYVSQDPEYIDMLPDPWPEEFYPGCAEKKLRKAIAESQQRPEFKTPTQEETWEVTITLSPQSGMVISTNSSAKGSKQPRSKSSKRSRRS